MNAKKIAERLKQARGNKTIAEVAKACKIAQSTLGMYETGRRVPRDKIKIVLARYYNTSVEALFFAN